MISFNTFNRSKDGLLTQFEVKENKDNYGISITDKSHYNPNASSFISNNGYTGMNPIYHFPDGQDNGLNMAAITNKNLDITEKEALYNKLKKKTGEEIDKLVESIEELEQSSNNDIDDKKDSTESKSES